MSFFNVEQAKARLNRSELAVPGSQPQMFEKAAKSAADVVFLDLEDAVAPDDKAQARKNIIQAIGDIDWGNKALSVRINGLDTHYMYRDVVDVIEQGGERGTDRAVRSQPERLKIARGIELGEFAIGAVGQFGAERRRNGGSGLGRQMERRCEGVRGAGGKDAADG